MKKTENAITLVALILTIVVLLILAVVAITAMGETNIISYANNAANAYKNEQEKENALYNEYEQYLANGGNSGTDPSSTITFSIDGVSYTVTSGTTWKQWGEANGWYYGYVGWNGVESGFHKYVGDTDTKLALAVGEYEVIQAKAYNTVDVTS